MDKKIAIEFLWLAGLSLLGIVAVATYDRHNRDEQAVVVANSRQEVVGYSDGAWLLFGWTRDEVLGRPITRFMPAESIAKHCENFGKALDKWEPGQLTRHDVVVVRANGDRVSCSAMFEVVISPNGERLAKATFVPNSSRPH